MFRHLFAILRLSAFALLIAFQSGALAGNRCEDLRFKNPNALIAPEAYSYEHSRGLNSYQFFLKTAFAAKVQSLTAHDQVIDLGAGLGLAGLQIARDTQAHVTVVNLQDFRSQWVRSLAELKRKGVAALEITTEPGKDGSTTPYSYSLKKIGSLTREAVSSVGHAFYYDVPRGLAKHLTLKDFDRDEIVSESKEIMQEYLQETQGARFTYKLGYAEDVLPQTSRQATLITDVFGAFFYSENRLGLINAIDRALKPDGQAYLSLIGLRERGVNDEIIAEDGSKHELFTYLASHYPEHFRIEGKLEGELAFDPPVLIYTAGTQPLALKVSERTSLAPYMDSSFVLPRDRYRIKK